jgi:hypothetical protein
MRASLFEEIKQWACALPAAVARRVAESISEVKAHPWQESADALSPS